MHVSLVPHNHIEEVWPNIESFMDGAARFTYGRFNVDDIKNDLQNKSDTQQLWIAFKDGEFYGAVVTEVWHYPRVKALIMHFTGGKQLPKWKKPMLALLQRFAKDNDCEIIESHGRPGWGKVFKKDGYKQRFVFYELPVE